MDITLSPLGNSATIAPTNSPIPTLLTSSGVVSAVLVRIFSGFSNLSLAPK
jgi:hypothetical protein